MDNQQQQQEQFQQPHQLYLEQQQYFAQFQNQQNQHQHQNKHGFYKFQHFAQQVQQLNEMGFVCNHKNLIALKRSKGCLEQAVQILQQGKKERREEQSNENVQELLKNTQSIILDCNNMKYSCKKWNHFHGKPFKQIKKAIKIIMKCSKQCQLSYAYLIWDVLQMDNLKEFLITNQKKQQNHYFQQIAEQINIINNSCSFSININNRILKFTITSSHPQIADDYIVNLLTGQQNSQTTVVTSDRELQQRLRIIGVQQFIGSGLFWKIKKLLKSDQMDVEQNN